MQNRDTDVFQRVPTRFDPDHDETKKTLAAQQTFTEISKTRKNGTLRGRLRRVRENLRGFFERAARNKFTRVSEIRTAEASGKELLFVPRIPAYDPVRLALPIRTVAVSSESQFRDRKKRNESLRRTFARE